MGAAQAEGERSEGMIPEEYPRKEGYVWIYFTLAEYEKLQKLLASPETDKEHHERRTGQRRWPMSARFSYGRRHSDYQKSGIAVRQDSRGLTTLPAVADERCVNQRRKYDGGDDCFSFRRRAFRDRRR